MTSLVSSASRILFYAAGNNTGKSTMERFQLLTESEEKWPRRIKAAIPVSYWFEMVARDGIEPPPPAFSGPPTNGPKLP
jgi:hypothetical protein